MVAEVHTVAHSLSSQFPIARERAYKGTQLGIVSPMGCAFGRPERVCSRTQDCLYGFQVVMAENIVDIEQGGCV